MNPSIVLIAVLAQLGVSGASERLADHFGLSTHFAVAHFKLTTGGQLVNAFPSNGYQTTRQRFWVLSPKVSREVRTLNDLQGLVRITTTAEALRFVRLRTDPQAVFYFDYRPIAYEVIDSSAAPEGYGLGLYSPEDIPKVIGGGYNGGLSHDQFVASGAHSPVVRKVAGGFHIERIVVRNEDKERGLVGILEETVLENGKYDFQFKPLEATSPLQKIDWLFGRRY